MIIMFFTKSLYHDKGILIESALIFLIILQLPKKFLYFFSDYYGEC